MKNKILDNLFLALMCFNAGLAVGTWAAASRWQNDIVKHGAAQHNPVTGDFEWKPAEAKP